MHTERIIIFDGFCNFCARFVQFIIKHDPEAKFKFTAFQARAGKEILEKQGFNPQNVETFLLIKDEKLFTKSDAALEIAKDLKGFWKSLFVFKILPKKIRNWFYTILAKNRYKLFGKRDHCLVPTDDIKARFFKNELK
jgi:predicted DCC family thiol-disulfide oxidoreductase YuxK